jgi:DNA-binding response OmpR family regulator
MVAASMTALNKEIDELGDHDMVPHLASSSRRVATRVPRIVLAEDDLELRTLLAETLRSDGYEVIEVTDGIHLRERLAYSRLFFEDRFDFDLIVSDIRMPGLNGFEALGGMTAHESFPPVILITAFGDQQTFLRASRFGAVAFFDKPIDFDKFRAFVAELLPRRTESNGAKAANETKWNPE